MKMELKDALELAIESLHDDSDREYRNGRDGRRSLDAADTLCLHLGGMKLKRIEVTSEPVFVEIGEME